LFGCVIAGLDCDLAPDSAEFTWSGHDEMDEASGDGWAELQADGSLEGEIAFDNGDESAFKARRWCLAPDGFAKRDPLAIAPYPPFTCRTEMLYSSMPTAEDIEKAVEQLAPRELARFRAWFETFDAAQFDAATERDTLDGKLDVHVDEAIAAHHAGRSCEL
jgi:hypothetical protein